MKLTINDKSIEITDKRELLFIETIDKDGNPKKVIMETPGFLDDFYKAFNSRNATDPRSKEILQLP